MCWRAACGARGTRSGSTPSWWTRKPPREPSAHLWAERFDHEFGDLFALENEVTARIANTLGWELIRLEVARPPVQPDALDYILRGRVELAKGTRSENIANAMSY